MRSPDRAIEHWRREIESVDISGRGTRRFRPAFRPAGRASPHDPSGYKGACTIGGAGGGAFTAICRQYFLALVAKMGFRDFGKACFVQRAKPGTAIHPHPQLIPRLTDEDTNASALGRRHPIHG